MGDFDRDLLLLLPLPVPRPRPLPLLLRLLLRLSPLLPPLLPFPPWCFFCFILRSHSETDLLDMDEERDRPDGVDSVLSAAVAAAAGASASALSSSLLSRVLFLPPPSPDAYSDDTAIAGANAAAVEVSASASASASPSVAAVTVGLAAPHAWHLRFLDALCRVHAVQAHSGAGPRRFGRLVESEAADPVAAAAVLVGEGALLSGAGLCLFLPAVVDTNPAAVGSLLLLLPPALVVSAPPPPPPPPASCSLLAYAASLDVRWRTWRRPPLPLILVTNSEVASLDF